jgi:hypothetical protein
LPLLAGCTASESVAPESSELITYPLTENWIASAGLKTGTLTIEEDCIRFEDGSIPVFPDSITSWDGTILTFAGDEYKIGDEMALGGDVVPEGENGSYSIPKSCGDGAVIIVSPPRPN